MNAKAVKNAKAAKKPQLEGATDWAVENMPAVCPPVEPVAPIQHRDDSYDEVEVECTEHEVHLGDGRVLQKGDTALVSKEIAADLKPFKNVKVG